MSANSMEYKMLNDLTMECKGSNSSIKIIIIIRVMLHVALFYIFIRDSAL